MTAKAFFLRLRFCFVVWAALGIAICGGCSHSSQPLVEVGGRITEAGKAVSGASVSYQPISSSKENVSPGPASFGITDADGRYQLRTFKEDLPGAVPGQHHVYITLASPAGQSESAPPVRSKKIPAKYCDGSTIVDVPSSGAAELNFDLAKQ